ncbi:MAG: replicative DNA helicase [Anaerolineales bacterium]
MSEYSPPEETSFSSTAVIPHNREAEEAVVGAVLINPEVYYDLAQFLQPEDFYIHRHRWIWEAFNRLHEQRIPIDFLTVTEELERAGQLAEIGGPAYLTALLNQVPTSLHAEAYGRMVEAAAIRRRLLTAANQIATLAYNEQETVENVIEEAEKHLFNVSERRLRHDVRPIAGVLSEYFDRVDELARRPEDIFGVPTGFIDLDRMLTGMQASDLLIIAGRPGQGKSGFLLSVARNAALLHKKRVAIFSLEMSNEQVVQRLLAQETGIDSQRLRNGKLNEDEWPLLTHAIEVLGDTQIYLDDTPAITPLQLRTKCRRLHMEFGLDLIVLDYLQLMGGDTRTENRVQEVSYISRSLKALARELNVPVLAAAQLSRAVEQRTDKRPVLSDLRESGCLTGETLIPLENGQHVPIRDLEGKTNFNIWALNPNTLKLEPMPVSRAFCTGTKPVFKMRTRLSREIRATGNHKFLSLEGWKRLDGFGPGEQIATPQGAGDWKSPPQHMEALRAGRLTESAFSRLSRTEAGDSSPRRFDGEGRAWPSESDIYWDSIVSIEPDGEEQVYDLTVPGHHNFVANNIIVHNSLEQDADVVMFIYRPDQYEKDTAKQNIAEIIVAKHRNGPTGSIELVFMSHLTKFLDAATRRIDFIPS